MNARLFCIAVGTLLPRLALAGESKLEPVVQTGHTGYVSSVSLSPDGEKVLTGSWDHTAILWDAGTGKKLQTFQGHTNAVGTVALSADAGKVLTGSGDQTAILWDAATGRKLQIFQGHTRGVRSTSLSADSSKVLTGSEDRMAILWDAATAEKLQVFRGHTNGVDSVSLSLDGRKVLTGSGDQTAILWDAVTGRKLQIFQGHTGRVTSTALSADGSKVLTASEDQTAMLWDAATGKRLQTFRGHAESVTSVRLSADASKALTGSWDQTAILWDIATGNKLQTFRGHNNDVVSVALSADGSKALTGSWDQAAILWDAVTGRKLQRFQGHTEHVSSLSVSADGGKLLMGSWDQTAILWDTTAGRMCQTFQGHTAWVNSVSLSADGRKVLTGSSDKTAILWDSTTGNKLQAFSAYPCGVYGVSLSADGGTLLTAGSVARGKTTITTVLLWDAATGRKVQAFQGHADDVNGVSLSADGSKVFTGSRDKTAILWDAATGKKLHTLQGHNESVTCVALSADGRKMLSGSEDKTAILWDVSTGKRLQTFQGHSRVTSVSLSADGGKVLMGSWDKIPILWDAATGKKLQAFHGHASWVMGVSLSADARRVLTAAADGTTRLWNADTGKELCALISIDAGKDWLCVTPEGLFDGSKGGRERSFFRIGKGLNVVPMDRFFQDGYYPGLLTAIWRGERPMPGKPIKPNPAPSLKILVNTQESVIRGQRPEVTVAVAVTDQGGGIKGPWLQHNGATLRTGQQLRKDGKTLHYRFPVALVSGDNKIEVRAATADGAVESEPAVANVRFDGKLLEPDLYVLAIGINRFAKDSGISNLEYCVPDARAVADLFQKRSGGLFKQVHVTPLYDDQASKEGILKAVTALADKARAQDTLVLYVASHGIAVGQRFYLIPYDFKLAKGQQPSERPKEATTVALRGYRNTSDEREAAVRAHGLAIDELGEALSSVPALKRVLIFDTCHSGSAIALAGKRQDPFAFRGAMERFSRAQGVYSLSATAADELAAENKELGHSILTYALLAGLKAVEAGPLKDQPLKSGKEGIDVLEWFRYARQHVPALSKRYAGRSQQVELSGEDQPSFPLLRLDGN